MIEAHSLVSDGYVVRGGPIRRLHSVQWPVLTIRWMHGKFVDPRPRRTVEGETKANAAQLAIHAPRQTDLFSAVFGPSNRSKRHETILQSSRSTVIDALHVSACMRGVVQRTVSL
jgi:hypothetical protein